MNSPAVDQYGESKVRKFQADSKETEISELCTKISE